MQINPHLSFNGQCEAAFKFYEQCLGGKVSFMLKYGDSPMAEQTPPAWRDKIIHATFMVDDYRLTGADDPPGSYQKPQGVSVILNLADGAEAQRIFDALAENGTVQMALQKTFFATHFAVLVDRFEVPWIINCAESK
jgi:PhnB protein